MKKDGGRGGGAPSRKCGGGGGQGTPGGGVREGERSSEKRLTNYLFFRPKKGDIGLNLILGFRTFESLNYCTYNILYRT
jgi:hypothetical protein